MKGFKKYYLDLITKFYAYLEYQPKISDAKNINSEVLLGMLVQLEIPVGRLDNFFRDML